MNSPEQLQTRIGRFCGGNPSQSSQSWQSRVAGSNPTFSWRSYHTPKSGWLARQRFSKCARHGSEESEVFFFCGLSLKVYDTLRRGGPMPDPLSPLVDDRSAVLRQISELGD